MPVPPPPPPPQYQQPPPSYPPPPFVEQPGSPLAVTGAFGQRPLPQPPAFAPPPAPNAGSVYQPLMPEFAVPQPPLAPPLPPKPAPVFEPGPAPAAAAEPRIQAPPSKGNPSAWLVCIEGPGAGRSYPIDEVQYWIGANPNNHLQLDSDPTVSGNHACIAFEQDALGVYDHHSTNGLFLNGERVTDERRPLNPGDKLRIGRSIFVLHPASGNRAT